MAKRKVKDKVLYARSIPSNEELFWQKWLLMSELEQERFVQILVPVIKQHWNAMDSLEKKAGKKEVLRMQAAVLNSYFVDLLRAVRDNDGGFIRHIMQRR